jgi:hypothetical protein
MSKNMKITNEKKNLTRLSGEFLVASRLTQRGYMISLQWGTTIGYDILVFDKTGKVAFIEVKTSASHPSRWILQKKYAHPEKDQIPLSQRFVCCVDLTPKNTEPNVFVFPAKTIAEGFRYFYTNGFSKSESYMFALDEKPRGRTKELNISTVGQYIEAEKYKENYSILGINTIIN